MADRVDKRGRVYQCSVCHKHFDKRGAQKHFLMNHIENKNIPYVCTICPYLCMDEEAKDSHLEDAKHIDSMEAFKITDPEEFIRKSKDPHYITDSEDGGADLLKWEKTASDSFWYIKELEREDKKKRAEDQKRQAEMRKQAKILAQAIGKRPSPGLRKRRAEAAKDETKSRLLVKLPGNKDKPTRADSLVEEEPAPKKHKKSKKQKKHKEDKENKKDKEDKRDQKRKTVLPDEEDWQKGDYPSIEQPPTVNSMVVHDSLPCSPKVGSAVPEVPADYPEPATWPEMDSAPPGPTPLPSLDVADVNCTLEQTTEGVNPALLQGMAMALGAGFASVDDSASTGSEICALLAAILDQLRRVTENQQAQIAELKAIKHGIRGDQ